MYELILMLQIERKGLGENPLGVLKDGDAIKSGEIVINVLSSF